MSDRKRPYGSFGPEEDPAKLMFLRLCTQGNLLKMKHYKFPKIWLNQGLLAASKGGHVSNIEDLIKRGANVNHSAPFIIEGYSSDRSGGSTFVRQCTPLRYAAGDDPESGIYTPGIPAAVDVLLKYGADPNYNEPACHVVTRHSVQNMLILQTLLKHGAKLNGTAPYWHGPLKSAYSYNNETAMKYLIRQGAMAFNVKIRTGGTPSSTQRMILNEVPRCISEYRVIIDEIMTKKFTGPEVSEYIGEHVTLDKLKVCMRPGDEYSY